MKNILSLLSVVCLSFFRVNDLTPHLLLSVREELDLELDESEYIKIHADNSQKGRTVFETFMSNMHNIA